MAKEPIQCIDKDDIRVTPDDRLDDDSILLGGDSGLKSVILKWQRSNLC